jgi:pimeloyl-ACP methyl ester carboxylesterase
LKKLFVNGFNSDIRGDMPKQILEEMSRVGEFVQLPEGRMRYEVEGPEDGEVIVLIHGLAGHMHIWDKNFHELAKNGFRVIRYDIFGRGFSERIEQVHNSDLFVGQLKGLADHLYLKKPFHLMGLSMGGAVSIRFTSAYPELVKSLVLVDAFGIPTPNDPLLLITRPKYLGEALMGSVGGPFIKAATARGVKEPKKHTGFRKWFTAPMSKVRSKRALLSSLRNFMVEDHLPHIDKVESLPIKKLIVWGEHDKVLPLNYGKQLHSKIPSAKMEVFENSGHIPHYEEPERFNELVSGFVNEQMST